MKSSKEMLSSILKTTQMGQIGIRSVMNYSVRPELRKALKSQLQEYDSIEAEAHALASRRGWSVAELSPGVRFMAGAMTRATLAGGNMDSKIAGMMIQGNTRGMIKSMKNQHHARRPDAAVNALNQKLIDRETENIKQMQSFL